MFLASSPRFLASCARRKRVGYIDWLGAVVMLILRAVDSFRDLVSKGGSYDVVPVPVASDKIPLRCACVPKVRFRCQ